MTPLEQHLIDRVRQLEREIAKLMRSTPQGPFAADDWIDSRRRADIELHEIALPLTGPGDPNGK